MTAVDRIRAVADAAYATEEERKAAIREARATEIVEAIKAITFPYDVTIGNAVVRISQPRRHGTDGFRFMAAVRVDGVLIDRDEHVIVNPPVLYPDDAGGITRKGHTFRIDPIACAAGVALDVARGRQK